LGQRSFVSGVSSTEEAAARFLPGSRNGDAFAGGGAVPAILHEGES